ncbi:Chaperonin beta protein [Salix suchowensis]|nr:Chaperonin beta protein [Salix suchowensis]
MASWSAENATKAYFHALKMGKRDKEVDVDEFISALAAGNNAQLMVIASVASMDPSHCHCLYFTSKIQPRCIKKCSGTLRNCVKFVMGDAKTLLPKDYSGADFVLVDCDLDDCKEVLRASQDCSNHGKGLVVGYNAFHKGSSWSCEFKTRFLPIGRGCLSIQKPHLIIRILVGGHGHGKRSKWITTIDSALVKRTFIGSLPPPNKIIRNLTEVDADFLSSSFFCMVRKKISFKLETSRCRC